MKPSEVKIAAATALSKIAEIRQLGLAEDYSYLSGMENVIVVNAEAKRATGIDMLDEGKSLDFEDFEKYEEFLERLIENNLSSPIHKSLLADEMQMLGSSTRIPLHSFRELRIEHVSTLVKETVKSTGLIPNSILSIAKSSKRIEMITGDDKNILALSSGTIKAKSVLFLFHLSEGPFKDGSAANLDYIDLTPHSGNPEMSTGATVLSCFIINPENSLLSEESLVPVFLQAMSSYCKDLTIGQNTKKFFYHGVNSKLMIDQSGKAKLHNYTNSNLIAIYAAKKKKTGYAYSFTYAVDIDLVKSNYRRGMYLS